MMTGADAGGMVTELLEGKEDHAETVADGGDYLPLNVWKTMGYNVTDIENNSEPCDKKHHKVLGDTYRVRILSKANTAIRATSRSTRLSTKRKFGEDAAKAIAPPDAELAVEAATQLALENAKEASSNSSNSSSRSSSSSSSSSSDRKKSKKSKKNKKAAKKAKKSKKDKKNKKHKKEKKGRKASCTSIYTYVGCRPCIGCVTMCCICVLKRFVALGLCSDLSLVG
jgi:cobalamin biosynthesis Mg chelatase CobN